MLSECAFRCQGHLVQVFNMMGTFKTQLCLDEDEIKIILTKGRNCEMEKSQLKWIVLFDRPYPSDKGETTYKVVVKIRKHNCDVSVLGFVSEAMALRALRIVLRRIQKILYSGIPQLYEEQGKRLGMIGPCQVSNICARYVPQSKNIKISLKDLQIKHEFIVNVDGKGVSSAKRTFSNGGHVAIFTNGKIIFMAFRTRDELITVFEKVQEMMKDCSRSKQDDSKDSPFSEKLKQIDLAPDREQKTNIWVKKRKADQDVTPIELLRKRRKLDQKNNRESKKDSNKGSGFSLSMLYGNRDKEKDKKKTSNAHQSPISVLFSVSRKKSKAEPKKEKKAKDESKASEPKAKDDFQNKWNSSSGAGFFAPKKQDPLEDPDQVSQTLPVSRVSQTLPTAFDDMPALEPLFELPDLF